MRNLISYSFVFIIIVTIVVSVLSALSFGSYEDFGINPDDVSISSMGFTWPLPGKYYISSYFGYRNIGIYGASNYHSGVDIPRSRGYLFLGYYNCSGGLYWI